MSLREVDAMNKATQTLREQLIDLFNNDSQRCLEMDSVVLLKIEKIRESYQKITHHKRRQIHSAYSPRRSTVNGLNGTSVFFIEAPLSIERLKVTTMTIGKKTTELAMTPKWFKVPDEREVLKNIRYPKNVKDKRPFNVLAYYRYARGENNDFCDYPIHVKQSSTETLVVALDAFVQHLGGTLSFTNEELSFEGSADRTACGVADLGSAHLLANEHLSSARFTLVLNMNYDDLIQSEQTMQQFILTFVDAVANDLSIKHDYVRVVRVERSTKVQGKIDVTVVLTTPEKSKTESIAEEFQLQPSDFAPKYNFDYTADYLPESQTRGGLPYYLPIGWYRHALRVDTKYQDSSIWLGSNNAHGEWPVAFHGTRSTAVRNITDHGLLTGKIVRDAMLSEAISQKGEEVNLPGLYVATHCNGGSHPLYTANFDIDIPPNDIESFAVVFQCRVRPDSYTRHTAPVCTGEAWRIVDPRAIRPYGILLKNSSIKVPYES